MSSSVQRKYVTPPGPRQKVMVEEAHTQLPPRSPLKGILVRPQIRCLSTLFLQPLKSSWYSQLKRLESESESCSVMCDSLWPHGLYSPWNSPGQNTGEGSCSLLQGGLPNPGIKPRSPALQADYLPAEPPRKPKNTGVGRIVSSKNGVWKTGCPHVKEWNGILILPHTQKINWKWVKYKQKTWNY